MDTLQLLFIAVGDGWRCQPSSSLFGFSHLPYLFFKAYLDSPAMKRVAKSEYVIMCLQLSVKTMLSNEENWQNIFLVM